MFYGVENATFDGYNGKSNYLIKDTNWMKASMRSQQATDQQAFCQGNRTSTE